MVLFSFLVALACRLRFISLFFLIPAQTKASCYLSPYSLLTLALSRGRGSLKLFFTQAKGLAATLKNFAKKNLK